MFAIQLYLIWIICKHKIHFTWIMNWNINLVDYKTKLKVTTATRKSMTVEQLLYNTFLWSLCDPSDRRRQSSEARVPKKHHQLWAQKSTAEHRVHHNSIHTLRGARRSYFLFNQTNRSEKLFDGLQYDSVLKINIALTPGRPVVKHF